MRGLRVCAASLAVVAMPAVARASTVSGTVFFDVDHDGVFSGADRPASGAVVAWSTTTFTRADANGDYQLTIPSGATGFVWASVPEGGVPGPVYVSITNAPDSTIADLPVAPLDPAVSAQPLSFIVAADSHMDGVNPAWTPFDVANAIDEALDEPVKPRFFTIVGDITQANRPEDFAFVDQAFSALTVPWVPVPGNHDWYDGGAAYRAKWGPDSYSFNTGGVHFIVYNQAASDATNGAFVESDLSFVDPAMPIVVFAHVPPSNELSARLDAAGVDYLFTGHWHSNRVVYHGHMIEFTTETFATGGIDLTPAGYRLVSIDQAGIHIDHHDYVDAPVAEVVWPPASQCLLGPSKLILSIETGTEPKRVEATVDDTPVDVSASGGWTWSGELPPLAVGSHTVNVQVTNADGSGVATTSAVERCGDEPEPIAPPVLGSWPQQQDSPTHEGAVADPTATPLAELWATAVGGHLHQSAPIAADGMVFVSVADFSRGNTGGLVALDARTGSQLWRFTTPSAARNSAAVGDGLVVFGTDDGVIRALDERSGALRWRVDVGAGLERPASALWAAPTIADGVVYVGVPGRVAAIDLRRGVELWTDAPTSLAYWLGSFAALAVDRGYVIGAFNRTSGLAAWSRDGDLRWRNTTDATKAINGAPIIEGLHVFVGNVYGDLVSFDLTTGNQEWKTALVDGGHDWGYTVAGNPAYADGRVFVPTQWGTFAAVDASTGDVLWTFDARTGPLRTAHARGVQPGFQASPVVTGDLVWVADTSGLLTALDVKTGVPRWSYDLRIPILGGLAVDGQLLLVPTWDGVVHAFAPEALVPGAAPTADPSDAGCCGFTAGARGNLALAFAAALLWWRRRRHGFTRRRNVSR